MARLDATARRVVSGVQGLRDERDELLDLLSIVLDGHQGDRSETAVAEIPIAVMTEIRRRVIGYDQ